MLVAILIFDDITSLDAVGPYEVLARIPGATVSWVAAARGPKTARGGLKLLAEKELDDMMHPHLLIVPGGGGVEAVMMDEAALSWIRRVHEKTAFTASVCTGSLLLGAAGLLKGVRATTHWNYMDRLEAFGAIPVRERVVREGRIITSAGVSAGIDMALELVKALAGEKAAQAIQLGIEYDPHPPFDAGSPDKAPPDVLEMVKKGYRR